MKKLALLVSILIPVLAAACSPADSVPTVHAQPQSAQVALWPAPAPDAVDGQVFEY
jgi:hypothetical protein